MSRSQAPRKVQVKFRGGSRWYTYLYDPDRWDLRVGDRVEVPPNSFALKPGWAEVVALGSNYRGACRMVVRRVPPEPWLWYPPAPVGDVFDAVPTFTITPGQFKASPSFSGAITMTVAADTEWQRINAGPVRDLRITPITETYPILQSSVKTEGRIDPPGYGDVFQTAKKQSHRRLMQDFKRLEKAAMHMVQVFRQSSDNFGNLDLVEAFDMLRDALENEPDGGE